MIAGLLSALVLLARPEAVGAEGLLAAGVVAAVFVTLALLRIASTPRTVLPVPVAHRFAAVRVRLRATDPSAEGHRRARAPGAMR